MRIRGKFFYRGDFTEIGVEIGDDGIVERIGKLLYGQRVEGFILPAGIDVHVHFRDFREKHKETIESGSLAALHGGICLVVDQPNTNPVLDSEEVYRRRMEIAEGRSFVDYCANMEMTVKNAGKLFDYVASVRRDYCMPAVGEVFLQHSSSELQVGYDVLREFLRSHGDSVKVSVHAEDPEFVEAGNPNFLFRKREAEIVAVRKCVEILKEAKARIHFCHISTPEAAGMLHTKSNATFEVTPHHLLLSVSDYDRLNGLINVNPPLRRKEDAEWLLKNFHLASVLASDHAPHTIEEKKDGASGFPGVETMYPVFVYLALKGVVSFRDLVERVAVNPARIFGFAGYGEVEVGNFANFAVFDKRDEVVRADRLHSLCGWTPYERFRAVFPREVYLRGEEVLSCEVKTGRILRRCAREGDDGV